jgi:hypothetical protein
VKFTGIGVPYYGHFPSSIVNLVPQHITQGAALQGITIPVQWFLLAAGLFFLVF